MYFLYKAITSSHLRPTQEYLLVLICLGRCLSSTHQIKLILALIKVHCILGKFSSTQRSQPTFVQKIRGWVQPASPIRVKFCWPWYHLKYLARRPSVGEFQLWCWGVAIGAASWLEGWRALWRRGILSIIFHWDEIKSRELWESCDSSHPSLL